MALLSKQDVESALQQLGQLASAQGDTIELVLMGGSVMVLVFETRQSTHDVDVIVVAPAETERVRVLARRIASERGWDQDWLNDAVKGFVSGLSDGPIVLAAQGILVRRPATEQLLAMKLCAWRDDVDIADAR